MKEKYFKNSFILGSLLSLLGLTNIISAIDMIDYSPKIITLQLFIFGISFLYFIYSTIYYIIQDKQNRQRFDDKYNAINNSNIVVIFNKDGLILEANRKFCDCVNFDEMDVVGKNHSFFVANETDLLSNEIFWQRLRSGEAIEGEFERKKKDGSSVWISSIYSPVRDAKGSVYQVIKIGQDITDDFKNRSEIMQTNIYLEHAGKILRHDMHSGINTYMPRAIKSLERRIDPDTIKKLNLAPTLRLLKDGLRHTQKVYSGVKEFTNLVKKDVSIDVENHNLSEILNEYLSLTAYKDQVIIDNLIDASVNEPLFCTAIDNFIRNGLKYNDSATKKVEIYMINSLTIGIEDNGRGMSGEEFKRYCLPYQRGINKESGSGLGLNISVAILNEHGFSIECEKTKKGTLIKVGINND